MSEARPMRLRGRGRLRFSPLFDLEDLDGIATSSIQMELAFGAGVRAAEDESFVCVRPKMKVFCILSFCHGAPSYTTTSRISRRL